MIAGSRFGGIYVWTDKRGGKHIIDLGTAVVNSEISFLDDSGVRHYYSIPTIQNLSYSQSVTLPSHPTLSNSYIQQYAKEEVGKLTFDIILSEDLYTNFDTLAEDGSIEQRDLTEEEFISIQENENTSIDEILNDTGKYTIKDIIGIIEDVKNNKRVFTLTTNSQMDDLLDNLVIVGTSYVHDKESRHLVACNVEAQRVHFATISYTTLSAAEVSGLITQTESENDTGEKPLVANVTLANDGDQKFDQSLTNKIGNFLLGKETGLHFKFGNAMKDYCSKQGFELPAYYMISDEINRSTAAADYLFALSFGSSLGVTMTQEIQNLQGAPYNFYTYPIKFTFGKGSEYKITNIYPYWKVNDSTSLISANPIFGMASNSIQSLQNKNDGVYHLLATYKSLFPIKYNTESQVTYDDIKDQLNDAQTKSYDRSETITAIPKSALALQRESLVSFSNIMGYEVQKMYPLVTVTNQIDSNGSYSSPTTLPQASEIEWHFGSVTSPWDINANATINEATVKSAWSQYVNGATVKVHYGILFVGELVLIVLFNPEILNETTSEAIN